MKCYKSCLFFQRYALNSKDLVQEWLERMSSANTTNEVIQNHALFVHRNELLWHLFIDSWFIQIYLRLG